MRILLTNDDGIHSEGLWAAARTLKNAGDVFVVAPDRDQSGIGTAMTLLDVLRVNDEAPLVEGVTAVSVQGTPADCVILATEALYDEPFDLLVSGINQGANLGHDILLSGTVGAALQGYLRGVPSIAMSIASLTDLKYEAAAETARALAESISANGLEGPLLINVNLPNVTPAELKGVEMTTLGESAFMPSVQKEGDARRSHYWIKQNRPNTKPPAEGTDVWAVRNGRVSITALSRLLDVSGTDDPHRVLGADVRSALHGAG